ncbi:MAG: carbohydrate ABC transporter permease [Oscillospiraceae bacterium]|jgi:putative aldouronate transport system permease protein|nr:carbohydrate ABC transporter permease [Oscillospiraceae bacterium]
MVKAIGIKKKRRASRGERALDITICAILFVLSLIFLYPLWQVIVASVSDPNVVMKKAGMILFPEGWQVDSYKIVFDNRNIKSGFANTVLYMLAGTGFQYLITLISGFSMSKKNAMLNKPLLFFMMFTMYFGGGLIPTYLLLNKIGLMNNWLVLILPHGVNVWNIIIMRTHMQSIPDSLSEAAYIDGANDASILFKIIFPLSGAVSAVLILFTAVSYWNMWFEPMIYLTERNKYPLQSILREILINNDSNMLTGGLRNTQHIRQMKNQSFQTLVKYANIVVSTVPILVVYPFLQKYFIKGMLVGSLKG